MNDQENILNPIINVVTRSMQDKAIQEVAKPYARQFVEAQLTDNESIKPLNLKNVNVALSLDLINTHYPDLKKDLLPLFDDTSVHLLNPTSLFNKEDCTYIDILVNSIPTRAIVDSGAPFCVISSAFAKTLKKQPDIAHKQQYGTAGANPTTSIGAYSALILQFGAIIVSTPAVVLPNNNYSMLIGTSFLKNYKVNICLKENELTIMNHSIPLHFTHGNPAAQPQKSKFSLL